MTPSFEEPTAFVLEDEFLISLELEEALFENGFRRIKFASDYAEAEAWLGVHTPTVAILDLVVRGEVRDTVASLLQARGVPTILHSGAAADPAFLCGTFAGLRHIDKPAREHELRNAVALLVAEAAAARGPRSAGLGA